MQNTWTDFVLNPDEGNRIESAAQRLNVARAVDTSLNGWDPALHPVRITQAGITRPDDTFEAMHIAERGDVYLWTIQRVWYVRRENGVKERLRWVPRHPISL